MNFETVIFFPFIHIHINAAFSSGILFSTASAVFQDFLSNKPTQQRSFSDSWKHKVPQSILYIGCYFSREHHKIAYIQQFL